MLEKPFAAPITALLLVACATDPEPATRPVDPGPAAPALVPAVLPIDPSAPRPTLFSEADLADPELARLARLQRELDFAVVLPIRPARAGAMDDVHRGVALADVLGRMLAVRGRDDGVERATFMLDGPALAGITTFFSRPDLFATAADRERWITSPMTDPKDLPGGLAEVPIRWVVGGQLLPAAAGSRPRVFLWIMDRAAGRVWSGTSDVDTPRLTMPRLLLQGLVTDAGLAPLESERGDMLWTEDLDDRALVALGRAAIAQGSGAADRDTLIVAATDAAPWSYTAWILRAWASASDVVCEPEARTALDRALSINPHADFFSAADALGCGPASLVDGPGADLVDAFARSGATNCAVAGKAIATVGGGREVPGAGFIAGLGGIYRNTTCSAGDGRDLAALAERVATRDPFVAAGLYLDVGVAAISDDALADAEEHFASAIAAIRSLPEPRACLPRLYAAEGELHLAGVMLQRGEGPRARAHIAAAERIGVDCHEDRLVGRAWNLLGLVEQAAGRYAEALAAFERALRRFEALGDDINRAVLHLNVGWTRVLVGQKAKAIPDLEKAVSMKRRVRSAGGVAVALESLAVTYMTQGRFAEAEPLLVEARDLTTDGTSRAAILNSLARIRAGQGRQDEANALLAEALGLARAAHARTLEAQIMQTKGGVQAELRAHEEALAAFNAALVMRREVGDRAGEGLTLSSLMTVADRLDNPTLAIVYGKLAIAAHQEVQASTRALGKEAELAFLTSREATYRQLAELLVRAGRLVEAERVLALLKIDEANEWTRSGETAGAVPLTRAEEGLARDYQKAADEVMTVGRQHGALAAKWPLTPAEAKQLEALRKKLEAANRQFGNFLGSLAQRKIEPRGLEELREGTGIGPDLAELALGTVAVYTLVADDALHLIVVSPDAQVAATTKVDSNTLNALVSELRRLLQDPRSDPRPIAKELYDVILAPIVNHLDGAKARTVLWSLDRALRYLPIGALWDGERWVAERWQNAVFTPASRARLKDKPIPQWRVLGAGVSQKTEGFSALPAVKDELAAIVDDADTKEVEGVLPGVVLLDQAFEKNAFLSLLGRKWPVVHIASHFAFEPGNKEASFLVLGQGRLSVAELEAMPNLFQGVDLLSLSACNTATGDADGEVGREVESFAVLAQRKGARAVMATLWPVADRSTSVLMRRFYALHKEGGLTKLAALQQAQLELASGRVKATDAALEGRGPRPLTAANTPATAPTPASPTPPTVPPADWTHPYYWAPFVLIGNTL